MTVANFKPTSKFHKIPSVGSGVVPFGETDTFRSFAKTPKSLGG